MANFKNYPIKDFSTDQKFLADDPNQVVRVTGQSMLDANIEAMKKSGKVVNSIDTLTEAIAGDYLSGIYLLVGGGTVTLDGDQAIYRVSDAGSGGIVMANGNELVLLFVANTPANIITPIDSVENIAGYTGTADDQQISLKGWHPDSDVGGGTLYWDATLNKDNHDGDNVFSPTVPWSLTTLDYRNRVGETDVGGAGCWVFIEKHITFFEKTWYVDPTGSDENFGTSLKPFLSIQKAVDMIPVNVTKRQYIQLADGNYSVGSRNTNPIPGSSTVRSVRVLVDGKAVHGRGYIVIQGNISDKSLCVIDNNDVYSSLYVEETNGVVLKDVTCDMSTNPGAAIAVFQHRRGDMRISDVTVSGNDFDGSHAFIVETGGFIEFAGDIDVTDIERCFVSLEGVMSFIGSTCTHDGGTTSAPRTFEVGSEGQIYIFSGAWAVTNVLRAGWNKGGFLLISPASFTVTHTGFCLDCVAGAHIEAHKIVTTGGAAGVNNDGGLVEISTCNFADHSTSAVINKNGGTVIVDDCTLSDSTNTKSIILSENGTVIVKGDGDFTGGFRQIFAKNTDITIEEQVNFGGAPSIQLDARGCNVRMIGTLANPITWAGYTGNAWNFRACNVTQTYCTVTNPASKTACVAVGTNIDNEGGVNIDGGFRGYDLSQNSSLTADTTTTSSITNATGDGINARRGSQLYYRASSMTFTGTGTPTVASAAEFSLVTSF